MENKEKPVGYQATEAIAEVVVSGMEILARPLRKAMDGLRMAALGGGFMGMGVSFGEEFDNKNKGENLK